MIRDIYESLYEDGRVIYNSKNNTLRLDKVFYARAVMWIILVVLMGILFYYLISEGLQA